MILRVDLGKDSYQIVLERGCLSKAGEYFHLNRKCLIVTDDGVPARYSLTVAKQCKTPVIVTLPQGEKTKTLDSWQILLRRMLEEGFTRGDCIVAVGGGVMGDLAGFAAAAYMRGIDFYNIPTTILSQVDSSIGGKTAVDFGGIKNIVGAFYQPKGVLIDTQTLSSLSDRQKANGLAEAVKMALTSDEELFALFEGDSPLHKIDNIVERSLRVKKYVVEQDEKEQGLRKILNFGHTIGHGIEAMEQMHGLYHGECVAIGMLPMCTADVRLRLLAVLKKIGLPTVCPVDVEAVYAAMLHDKKMRSGKITVIEVETVGQYAMTEITPEEMKERLMLLAEGRLA